MSSDSTANRLKLASRVWITPEGKRLFLRFTDSQRLEHIALMLSFTMLSITGLVQKFGPNSLTLFIIRILGGIEGVRYLHHLSAIVMIAQSVYHLGMVAHMMIVRKQRGQMWPNWQDARDIWQMVRFNLGLTRSHPRFGRFAFDEKLEYWAMIWGTVVMTLTGFIMWFPTWATTWLPGESIPISKAIHGWEAILAVLAILTWHMYNVLIRTVNRSIFTGWMSEEQMQHEHPLEYETIMADCQCEPGPAQADGQPSASPPTINEHETDTANMAQVTP